MRTMYKSNTKAFAFVEKNDVYVFVDFKDYTSEVVHNGDMAREKILKTLSEELKNYDLEDVRNHFEDEEECNILLDMLFEEMEVK